MVRNLLVVLVLGLLVSSCYVRCDSRIDGRNISVLQGSIAESIHCG